MDVLVLVSSMGTMFLMMAVGFLCSRVGLLNATGNKVLAGLVINVGLTAKTVDAMVNTEIQLEGGEAFRLGLAVAAFYLVLWLVSLVFGWTTGREHRGLYEFMMMFANIAFLGYPIVSAVLGEEMLFYVAVFNIPFNILVYTYGIFLLKGSGAFRSWRTLVSPPLVAVVVSLVLLALRVKLPVMLAEAVSSLGTITVPGAMLVIGASLGNVSVAGVWRHWRVLAMSLVSLLVRPLLVWAVLGLVVESREVLAVGTILAAMPVAVNTTALCIEYGTDEALGSAGVMVTTVLSLVTIPVIGAVLL